MFSTTDENQHKVRRKPINKYFSRQAVTNLEPHLRSLLSDFYARLEQFRGTGQPVELESAFYGYTIDVTSAFAFGKAFGSIQSPDFGLEWQKLFMSWSEMAHLMKQFPWLKRLMESLPEWLIQKMNPGMTLVIQYRQWLEDNLKVVIKEQECQSAGDNGTSTLHDHRTIFHELLASPDLPEEDKRMTRLIDEGMTVIAAGSNTLSWFFKTIFFHILANPSVLARLKAELEDAIPNAMDIPTLLQLEQLPYLDAVIKEGFRLSFGVTHRLQRIAPNETLQYGDYSIPPGTPISMTPPLLHLNRRNFVFPELYDPRRWLQRDSKTMEKYLVNFSRGTRRCPGMNLAKAEIYIVVATMLRRFDLELFETERADVDLCHDFFNPCSRIESKGCRVIIKYV